MRERGRIYLLLFIGGLIVLVNYAVAFLFKQASPEEWAATSVLHIIGGGYAVFFIRALFLYTKTRHTIAMPLWMETVMFIGGALLLGVAWEWFELALDRYSVWILGNPSTMTYAENIGDLVFDFLGAAAAGIYVYARRARARV